MTTTTNSLTGRTAFITGASSGIGEATARALATDGATVVLTARRKERLDRIAAEITAAGGTAHALELDVTDAASVASVADRVAAEVGAVDLVFANAGVMYPEPLENLRTDQWAQQVDLNLNGLLNTVASFLPVLTEAAEAGRTADLVLTSSTAGQHLMGGFAVYSATKAFVSHFADHARMELGQKFVRTTAIEPGMVATELGDHVTDERIRAYMAGAPDFMELLSAAEVAEVVRFVVSQPRHVNLSHVRILPTQQEA